MDARWIVKGFAGLKVFFLPKKPARFAAGIFPTIPLAALFFSSTYAIIKLPMRKREYYAVLLIFQGFGHVRFHAH